MFWRVMFDARCDKRPIRVPMRTENLHVLAEPARRL